MDVSAPNDLIVLNIGGTHFQTRKSTLLQSNSFFSGLVSFDTTLLFVDRDATHFRYVLNWLRGVRVLPEDDTILNELECEADYYCIHTLVDAIRSRPATQPSIAKSLNRIRDELRQLQLHSS